MCPISREGWARIAELKLTRALFASSTGVTDDSLITLVGKQPGITMLQVHKCPITDAAVEAISRLPQLRSLWIADTGVTDAGLAALSGPRRLSC